MMIEVDGLTRYYGDFLAVRDVSFRINERMIVGFLGLNGAGKSTVLKVLGGLLMPSAGRVAIAGVDALDAPDSLRQKIGYLPEDPPLYKEMRVSEFLLWCGEIKGMSRSSAQKRLPEVLKLCHLSDVQHRIIGDLSHGYKKRVGIAQAIIHEPELVILDEPISGLDPVQIVEMREVLKSLKATCTVLISSHILSEISQTCDRILVLHDGKIVAEGTESELRARLRGALRVELVLRGDADAVRAIIDAVEGVSGVELVSLPDGLVHASVTFSGADERELLIRSLVEAGVGIRTVEEDVSGELESVFLGLTKAEHPGATAQSSASKEERAAEGAV